MDTITKTYYAIQHIPSGMCLPEKGSRKGKGGYTKDVPDDTYPPRLFGHPRYAFDALRWWLAGIASEEYDYEEGDLIGIVSAPVTDRRAKDMRVVIVTLSMPSKDHPYPPLAFKQ